MMTTTQRAYGGMPSCSPAPPKSDDDLKAALDEANVGSKTQEHALDAYQDARLDGLRSGLAILALLVVVALFFAQRIPSTQPGEAKT
jgi:hypothetical protein